MTPWTPPQTLAPEIELLVRRWKLPVERAPDVAALLEAQQNGATALRLNASADFGPAAREMRNVGSRGSPRERRDQAEELRTVECGLRKEGSQVPSKSQSDSRAALARASDSAASSSPAPTLSDVERAPLVVLHHNGQTYLQSWRYYEAERTIAREILAKATTSDPKPVATSVSEWTAGPSGCRAALARATPALDVALAGLNDHQLRAVRCALAHRLALITGGPGTGKTYTLARLLALQLERGAEAGTIQLAAPTGKAAERMKDAVEAAADQLPESIGATIRSHLKRVAAGACTLHRLLGANPATGRCRFDAQHRLPCRILIIDECSMVDTLLWQALLMALRPETQLILVGDPHQLESVRAGDVLGSLVRFARSHRVLGDVWVELTESRRFQHRPAIGALARAIINSDPAAALALLHSPGSASVPPATQERTAGGPPATQSSTPPSVLRRPSSALCPPSSAAAQSAPSAVVCPPLSDSGLTYLGDAPFAYAALPKPVREAIEAVAFATDPATALAALNRVRFLAAHREHSFGVAGLNTAIQHALEKMRTADCGSRNGNPDPNTLTPSEDSAPAPVAVLGHPSSVLRPPALPIIVNRNDPETRLSNGSVGVIMTIDGVRRAYFPASGAGEPPRSFALSQLPDHSPAWAMTIHRSQGSEFDHVVVVLPRDDSPLATRELLYTAITRAKDHVYLSGSTATLRSALSTHALRCTLLERALRGWCDDSEFGQPSPFVTHV